MIRKPKFTMLPIIIGAFALLSACNQTSSNEPLQSGILLKDMDTTAIPGNDFMKYVGGTWLKNTKIPADKASYGPWDLVIDSTQGSIKQIIENAAKGDPKDGSEEQKIGDFYEAYMNMKVRDSIGIIPLAPEFKKIDSISSPKDLAAYFGYASKLDNLSPIAIDVISDFKDPKKYMLYSWQNGLGLPEREYYLSNDAKSVTIRAKYVKHVQNMLTMAKIADPAGSAAKIMKLETTLAAKQMKKEDTRNMAALYNKYATKNLATQFPGLDWTAILAEAGVAKADTLTICQVDYTKSLAQILKATPLDTWKTYLKWGVIHGAATSLNDAVNKENFDFYSKTLYGVNEQRPLWRRGVERVNGALGEMVGKLYVEKYFPPAAKERMMKMVNNLLKAYESSIKTLEWMSAETKKEALAKLSKFTTKIGYPDKWKDYSSLKVVKHDLYGNKIRSRIFDYNRTIDKLGKPVDRSEWTMNPQTINAYYNPTMNEIVFPAAILQPPFFNMKAEDAINYGAIGAVIGHEIGHGFDDQGSTFDGDGVMRNWWTPKDKIEFKKRTGALIEQYNGFKVFPDLNVNGTFTQGENIGDLGGLGIALKAYKASLAGKPAPKLDGFTGEQRVFIGYGQVWIENSREEALRSQVSTDPHSPAKFRLNGIVRNIDDFYTAFNVKPTDSLYLAPEKRVKIW